MPRALQYDYKKCTAWFLEKKKIIKHTFDQRWTDRTLVPWTILTKTGIAHSTEKQLDTGLPYQNALLRRHFYQDLRAWITLRKAQLSWKRLLGFQM